MGNSAVRSTPVLPCLQPALKIGGSNDRFEQEADRVAARIMSSANDNRAKQESRPRQWHPRSAASSESHARVQRQCASCKQEDDKTLQRKISPTVPSGGGAPYARPAALPTGVTAQGQPLEQGAKHFFESRFGTDFSHVRIHSNPAANALSQHYSARAFTYGRDIVFSSGEYNPRSVTGRHLLAHELTHVLQQTGGPSSVGISPVGSQYVQRVPGVDAPDSWNAVVAPIQWPTNAGRNRVAQEAKSRMLRTTSGQNLINALWRLFCRGRRHCRSQIHVVFTDTLPAHRSDASGFFEPNRPNQPRYNVWVRTLAPRNPNNRGIILGGAWPSRRNPLLHFSHTDPESAMASTLYHECLHVWFIHAGRQDIGFSTGHGDVELAEIEPQFLDGLRTFTAEIDELERRIRQRAARQNRPVRRAFPKPSGEPVPVPPPKQTSPNVNGLVELRGGSSHASGSSGGTGMLGADVILGRLHGLRLGVRGLYLTPDRLLLGGAMGLRALEDGINVNNPLFFDIEAGVLAEVPTADTANLRNRYRALGAIGIGQEMGATGTRFFWRVGGYVIISDEGIRSGGPTGGVGLRF
ncbi:eCIS core domain-containing protein [Teredinibacter purpureus]|uniref:eCIS core domain-containing protein n=1 Tax=Teredinibacter purpureus TaxID=2731756 RepID=UPI0005F88088|nr:DUF4157 domain-containing protein [Teredinibacter purpureus]